MSWRQELIAPAIVAALIYGVWTDPVTSYKSEYVGEDGCLAGSEFDTENAAHIHAEHFTLSGRLLVEAGVDIDTEPRVLRFDFNRGLLRTKVLAHDLQTAEYLASQGCDVVSGL